MAAEEIPVQSECFGFKAGKIYHDLVCKFCCTPEEIDRAEVALFNKIHRAERSTLNLGPLIADQLYDGP